MFHPGFPCKSTSEGINGSTAKRSWEGQPQPPCVAFPQLPLPSFVPGAGLGPREAGDASTKASSSSSQAANWLLLQRAADLLHARGSSVHQNLQRHGMLVSRVCLGAQDPFQEKRRSWYFPAEALSPSCPGQHWHSAGTTSNLQKNSCYLGLHFTCVTSCPAPRCCFTLPVAGVLLSISHLIKWQTENVIPWHYPKLGVQERLFVSNSNHAVRPKPQVLAPTIFLLGTTNNMNISGSCWTATNNIKGVVKDICPHTV